MLGVERWPLGAPPEMYNEVLAEEVADLLIRYLVDEAR